MKYVLTILVLLLALTATKHHHHQHLQMNSKVQTEGDTQPCEFDPCEGLEGYVEVCHNGADDFSDLVDTSVLDSPNACQVQVTTSHGTCADYCESQGRYCVAAQDNTGNTCNLDGAHDRKSTDNNGCDQAWNNQVCVCDYIDLLPDSTEGGDEGEGEGEGEGQGGETCQTEQLLTVFRPSNGVWYTKGADLENWANSVGNVQVQTGTAGDVPVRGDFLGDGVDRIAVWRPSNGVWYINMGDNNEDWTNAEGNIQVQCGTAGDIPVPMDYFGEGKLRFAVFRPSNGNWYIKGDGLEDWTQSSGNVVIQCGTNGDVPVPGDYFGEGQVRIVVWRPSNGNWYVKGAGIEDWGNSSGNITIQCGTNGDVPVPFDYFQEGQLRFAVWRPSNGVWYIKGEGNSSWGQTSGNVQVQCGTNGDVPLPGYYTCENDTPRLTVWRPSDGNWYIKGAGFENWGNTQGNTVIQCGTSGDIPIEQAAVPHGVEPSQVEYEICETEQQLTVFRPSNGVWYTKGADLENWANSSGNVQVQTGTAGDVPVRGDFLGDGVDRIAVFRPSNGVWYINMGDNNEDWTNAEGNIQVQCGTAGDIPVPMDYFGEGKLRFAVFRPSNGNWYIKGDGLEDWTQSSGNVVIQCGTNGDVPVPGDYFGEGQVRIAVWRPSNGVWYVKGAGNSNWTNTEGNITIQCGINGDVPVPFDYFQEGQLRFAVWRPSNGVWYIKGQGNADWGQTSGNHSVQCGTSGDVPLPGYYTCENDTPRLTVWRPSDGNWYIKGAGFENWGNTQGNTVIQCGTSGDIPIEQAAVPHGVEPSLAEFEICETEQQLTVFRPSNGVWYTKGADLNDWANSVGNVQVQTGTAGDVPVRGDFLGDGVDRIAVWRPSNGVWYINMGDNNENWTNAEGNIQVQCGTAGDIPVPMDFYGEGKLRFAVFRPSNGNWYIKGDGLEDWAQSSENVIIQCGTNGDVPVPGDYFGEGQARIVVWRPSNGNWYVKGAGIEDWADSTGNITIQCGINGDVPVPFDYFQEGQLRFAVWRPSNGVWYIKGEGNASWGATSGNISVQCGTNGDIPLPGYYGCDEDDLPRLTVFRPANGNWYIKGAGLENWGNSQDNLTIQCGTNGDVPIEQAAVPHGVEASQVEYEVCQTEEQLTVFRPSNGVWYTKGADLKDWAQSSGNVQVQTGTAGDVPLFGDFLGDGVQRRVVWRPSNGVWYINMGDNNEDWTNASGNIQVQCGTAGDIPVPFDFFNEGKLRFAVFRPSNGVWYIKGDGVSSWGQSSGNIQIQCGTNGDRPVPGNYFGDGVRIAVWRPANGTWYIKGAGNQSWGNSSGNVSIQCGINGDVPVPFDYFQEGVLRVAVWRPSNGVWYIKGQGSASWGATSGNLSVQCGTNGDVPLPGYYTCENDTPRLTVWRPSDGNWYIKGAGFQNWGNTQGNTVIQCGTSGDIPLGQPVQ